ncbi:hypothetical protein DCC81_25150 [Chitinophaga parva]|uniref:Uncharacterized protein n=1 Tax=Chitinophaga parva TaxID=2169414 RepID=A0A2T7BB83_9BACT|nr:hypothetical protein [Chitinophaga parva]PUZ21298.1 hypothetical protein DCC81_25150 [Chitinophaga parva]
MKIEIKNISHSERLSEETHAFAATLYIDGKKVGNVRNEGMGGPTDIAHESREGLELIRQAENWCNQLPPTVYPAEGSTPEIPVDMSLESHIDALLLGYLQEKDRKQFLRKMEKAMLTGIVVCPEDANEFGEFKLKGKVDDFVMSASGRALLVKVLKTILPKMKEGDRIVNRNIPVEIYKAAGLADYQYPPAEAQKEDHIVQRKGRTKGL